jgi:hypothetical protein
MMRDDLRACDAAGTWLRQRKRVAVEAADHGLYGVPVAEFQRTF